MHRSFDDVPKQVAIAHFCNEVQYHGIQTDQQIIKIATATIVGALNRLACSPKGVLSALITIL